MDSIEVTAKKVDDAIKEGLKQLSATLDDVDVKVLDTGGFFRKAKIVVSLTEEVRTQREKERAAIAEEEKREARRAFDKNSKGSPLGETTVKAQKETAKETERFDARQPRQKQEPFSGRKETEVSRGKEVVETKPRPQPEKPRFQREEAPRKEIRPTAPQADSADPNAPPFVPKEKIDALISWLDKVLEKIGVQTGVEYKCRGRDLDVTLLTDDGAVIGYRGETLDSLEYLAGLVINKDNDKYVRVSLDCNSYRNKREEALVKLAEKMAAKCIKQGHKVSLEPMNSVSRKVIHAALADNHKITTKSEGKEPNRRVVIYCKRD